MFTEKNNISKKICKLCNLCFKKIDFGTPVFIPSKKGAKMEQLNYHKLVNLRKRFDKYDCAISAEIVAVVDKHLELERQKSIENDTQRREAYQKELVQCNECGKALVRKSLYKHMKVIHKK